MHMIDVMNKLKDIAESGYDNEDIQRGIVAASKHQVEEAEVAEEKVDEAYIYTRKDAIDLLANLRAIGKKSEGGGQLPPGFANRIVNDLWDVITWIEANVNEGVAEGVEEDAVEEGRLGFSDMEKLGPDAASKIDTEARRRGSADMSPGDADQLRYKVAKEMGLVEAEVAEEKVGEDGDYPTYDQMRRRDEIYMSMKNQRDEYKKKYGGNWKGAMLAIALKKAMAEGVEEDDVEEVHEDVDDSLEDILKLAGRSGVIGMNHNIIIAESLELDEEEVEEGGSGDAAMHADADADEKSWDDAEDEEEGDVEMEETVEVPVSALQDLMRLAGYSNYESKIQEYENDPEEEYMDAEDQLVGLSGGLNGPKGMYPTAAGGDNAMAVSALKVKEDTLSFESFYKKYQEFVTEEK